jgi:hypothetical protein
MSRPGPKRAIGETRELVRALHEQGKTGVQIARELGINRSTVVYHLRNLGKSIDPRFGRRYDWPVIAAAYESGLSARQCRVLFGCTRAAWAEAVRRGDIEPRPWVIPIEELLVKGRRTSRSHLKARLIAEGLKKPECEECGLSSWRGKPLAITLHHINGDPTDNRLCNLMFLCPNCHSQTDTFGGRNGHRRPKSTPACDENRGPEVANAGEKPPAFVTLITPWTSISAGAWLR